MTYLEILFLALILSLDAFIVSFSYGLTFQSNRLKNSLLLALFTGGFQGVMPCLGYYLTSIVQSYISNYANIIIFLIFGYLGIKFILEAFQEKKSKPKCIGIQCLILIGVATSIDAFSAGITLLLYENTIILPAFLITLITVLNSLLGYRLGYKLKKLPTKNIEIIAGLILVLLGIKALF